MSLVDDLRRIKIFADLPEEDLAWLAGHGTEVWLATGERLFNAGDPADRLFVFFEGEVQVRRDGVFFAVRAGDVSGMLPYSRMTQFSFAGYAVSPTRLAWFSTDIFPEMLRRMPVLANRLVGLLTERVREATRMDQQREKLAALGKLSAGLAHELNNPAAAARRAASALGEMLVAARENNVRLNQYPLSSKQREVIARFELEASRRGSAPPVPLNSLEQSDHEERLTAWLERHGVSEPWKIAPVFVDGGIDEAMLDALVEEIGPEPLREVVGRVTALLTAASLVREIEHSTARISELVAAIKEYSYMDQSPEQEVDLHTGLESTLTIMSHKLKKAGVLVKREYDRSLPRICAWGSELNQVWTNLIDNAVDAMTGVAGKAPRELTVRTARDPGGVLIEIGDTGPGISNDIRGRIFDPFFTTKEVGEGTGLGLDTVRRIVLKHRGDIQVQSKPGDTRFQVRLPVSP